MSCIKQFINFWNFGVRPLRFMGIKDEPESKTQIIGHHAFKNKLIVNRMESDVWQTVVML